MTCPFNTASDRPDDYEVNASLYHHQFWLDIVASRERYIIAAGHCYAVGNEATRGMRGFGGRRWRIWFFDGSQVGTSNLWSQGEVPDRFRRLLPDNAVVEDETTHYSQGDIMAHAHQAAPAPTPPPPPPPLPPWQAPDGGPGPGCPPPHGPYGR